MFGKKQDSTRELEEKLNIVQMELENAQAKLNNMQNYTQQILPFFESQIIAQSEMDKELTKVVSHAYDTIEGVSDSKLVLEHLAMELTTVRGQLEDEERDKKRMLETAHKLREQMETISEENEHMAEPAGILQDIQNGMIGDAGLIRGELEQMQEYAKQMTVSSLNCAIEAGRIGEAGLKFVEAAEDVRLLSGAYERSAAEAAHQLDAMEERISRLEHQLEVLAKSCKESDAAVVRMARGIAEQEAICSQAAERIYLEKTAAMSENLKEISQKQNSIDELQHQTLDEIENIGESFMSEQEARKGLEQVFDQMIKNMRA